MLKTAKTRLDAIRSALRADGYSAIVGTSAPVRPRDGPMTSLDARDPLRSFRALVPGLSHARHGAAREPPVSDVAVIKAENAGDRIQVSTLAAYCAAAGYKLVLSVEPL